MAFQLIGFKRLYIAPAFTLNGTPFVRMTGPLGERLHIEVYIGPKPRFGDFQFGTAQYILPDISSDYQASANADSRATAPQLEFTSQVLPREPDTNRIYTEIICWVRVNAPNDLQNAIKNGDADAVSTLIDQSVDDLLRKELTTACDLVAGVIGLRGHRQVVGSHSGESFVLTEPITNRYYINARSGLREIFDHVTFFRGIEAELLAGLQLAGVPSDMKWQSNGSVLHWLLRAWEEEDTISKFLAFFVPLEMILEGVSVPKNNNVKKGADKIYKLIDLHGGTRREKGELRGLINDLISRQRSALEDRFVEFAQTAKLSGWEQDILAFREFNKHRNAIVHRGATDMHMHLVAADKELPSLSDLAERYIGYAIFGDAEIYPSRARRIASEAPSQFSQPSDIPANATYAEFSIVESGKGIPPEPTA